MEDTRRGTDDGLGRIADAVSSLAETSKRTWAWRFTMGRDPVDYLVDRILGGAWAPVRDALEEADRGCEDLAWSDAYRRLRACGDTEELLARLARTEARMREVMASWDDVEGGWRQATSAALAACAGALREAAESWDEELGAHGAALDVREAAERAIEAGRLEAPVPEDGPTGRARASAAGRMGGLLALLGRLRATYERVVRDNGMFTAFSSDVGFANPYDRSLGWMASDHVFEEAARSDERLAELLSELADAAGRPYFGPLDDDITGHVDAFWSCLHLAFACLGVLRPLDLGLAGRRLDAAAERLSGELHERVLGLGAERASDLAVALSADGRRQGDDEVELE